jgi:hypothetical protein
MNLKGVRTIDCNKRFLFQDCCNWEELHLEFVKLLRLCFSFIANVTSNSDIYQSLSSRIMNLISVSVLCAY